MNIPSAIRSGEAIALDAAATGWAQFVSGLAPGPELLAELERELARARSPVDPESDDYDDSVYLDPVCGRGVIDAGNTVDGAP